MYSDSILTWTKGETVTVSSKRGWKAQLWTALATTTTEPSPDNAAWQLDTPVAITGITVRSASNNDNSNYLKMKIKGITLMSSHIARPEQVRLTGITFIKRRILPYILVFEN